MSIEQRLDTVKTDLEQVKQLLASAARYGESTQRRLDAVGARLDAVGVRLDQQQAANQDQLDRALDEFILQAQRLMDKHSERAECLEGAFKRIEVLAAYVTSKQDNHDQMLQALSQIAPDQSAILQRQDENDQGQAE